MASNNDFPVKSKAESFTYTYKWDVEFYDSDDPDNKELKIRALQLEKITKLCLYKERVSPVLTGQFHIKRIDIVKLNAIKKRCLCTITVKKMTYASLKSEGQPTAYSQVDECIAFSSTFIPVFDPKTFKTLREEKIKEDAAAAEALGAPNGDITPTTQTMYATFFNITSQNLFKKVFNNVIKGGGSVGDIVAWVLGELGVRYLVDTPTGEHGLPDIVIPPLNTVQTFDYLQSSVGIYENGFQIFYDYDDILYVLDKYASDHECEEGDTVITHIYVDEGSDIAESGARDTLKSLNDNKESMYIGNPLLNYETEEIMDSELKGDTFVFSSFQQSINAVGYDTKGKPASSTVRPISQALLRSDKGHTQSGNKVVVDYDELNNPVNMASYFNEIEAKAQKIRVAINGIDINDFKANKLVELHFKDTNLNNVKGGLYYLNSARFAFSVIGQSNIFKEPSEIDDMIEKGAAPTRTSCNCILYLSRKNQQTS